MTVNLEASEKGEVIAYKARRNAPVIELNRINYYSPEEFWEVRHESASKSLILEPGDFYILASRERVRVPAEFAAEMVRLNVDIIIVVTTPAALPSRKRPRPSQSCSPTLLIP